MFKLPNSPSPGATTAELADFIELMAWDRGVTSQREVEAFLGRVDDQLENVGIDDDDVKNEEFVDDVMNEIQRRSIACGSSYPFILSMAGSSLRHEPLKDSPEAVVYHFLLMATRLNMSLSREHAGLDGTFLFEELSADVLRNYLGRERSRSFVFGTSLNATFSEKVNALCGELREGGCFREYDPTDTKAKDSKLDAVAWVPFTDGLAGQLVIFSQCKTGTNWTGFVQQLQPRDFLLKHTTHSFASPPVRAFCVAEAVDRSLWGSKSIDAGVLFDRCRIVDWSNGVDTDLLHRLEVWTAAAKETVNYSM